MNRHISVKGVGQGIEFSSLVYELATRLNLHGWVCNTTDGVEILVQGTTECFENFMQAMRDVSPSSAEFDDVAMQDELFNLEYSSFDIHPSADAGGPTQSLPVDLAICPDCERELFDPHNRRYLYPFINCSHCGPRFTILKDIPYERSNTTMDEFGVCEHCGREYNDPRDRHFHAQPIACPDCGPFVALREIHSQYSGKDSKISSIECRTSAVLKARRLLREGYILGIKGIGGFHLACDASNSLSVEELRDRKGRIDKPFAVMAANMEVVRSICHVNDEEEALLQSPEKPIVLLEKKTPNGLGYRVSKWVAPNLDYLGVMLPYTPLHHLLLTQKDPLLDAEPAPALLVMTSGNFSEEPTATDDEEALQRLSPLVDAFILHNREIYMRCDDSVVRLDPPSRMMDHQGSERSSVAFLRRGRGYAPYLINLPCEVKPTLAVGGERKNAFCLAQGDQALISHPVGDMEKEAAHRSFEQGIAHLSHLSHASPEIVACDLNPDHFSTQYTKRLNMPHVAVQHHHAHIVSCMVDNHLDDRRVIGLAFDGTGYGTDGALWGGEVLLASFASFERFAHLEYLPLPGADSATHAPWRTAMAYAQALKLSIDDLPAIRSLDEQVLRVFQQEIGTHGKTSSMGCLFDAVACLIGLRNEVTYEAQAAMELETLARPFIAMAGPYPYHVDDQNLIRVKDVLNSIIEDVRAKRSAELIAARFHRTVAAMSVDICKRARELSGLNEVVLSGGVWQNRILLLLVRDALKQNNFVMYSHHQVPTNDGGLSLGQAVIANYSCGVQEIMPATTSGKYRS